jgi:hypothetical protein
MLHPERNLFDRFHTLAASTPGRGREWRPCDMVFHMKTTLNIDDGVMARLKQEAARRGTTMSELVEAGIRLVLEGPGPRPRKELPPLPTFNSGGFLVDVADRDALYRVMDGF